MSLDNEKASTIKFSELADLVKDSYTPISSEDFPYIGLEHIDQNTLRLNKIGSSCLLESGKHKFQTDDVLYGKLRPYFRKVYKPNFSGVCSTDIWVIRAKDEVDPDFLFYAVASKKFTDAANASSTGTRMPRANWESVSKLQFQDFSSDQQKNIGKILGDFDRKIELNRLINVTLGQIGQALFNKYFVDNPEKENWNESQISDFSDYKKTSRKPQEEQEKEFLHYSIPAFDNGLTGDLVLGSEIKSNKYQVTNNSILVSKLNPSTPRVWPVFEVSTDAICSTEFVVLQPKKYYSFLYFLLNSRIYQETMTSAAGGTSNSHKRVSPGFINSFSFPEPPEDLLEEFELLTKGLLVRCDLNIKMNNMLTDLRESLLPKLIEDEIEYES